MSLRTYEGATVGDLLSRARRDLGADAVIIEVQQRGGRVVLTAADPGTATDIAHARNGASAPAPAPLPTRSPRASAAYAAAAHDPAELVTARAEAARLEAWRTQALRAAARVEATRAENMRANATRAEAARNEAARTEADRTDTTRAAATLSGAVLTADDYEAVIGGLGRASGAPSENTGRDTAARLAARIAARQEPRDNVRAETRPEPRADTREGTRDGTRSGGRDETRDWTRDETREASRNRTRGGSRDETHAATREGTRNGPRNASSDESREPARGENRNGDRDWTRVDSRETVRRETEHRETEARARREARTAERTGAAPEASTRDTDNAANDAPLAFARPGDRRTVLAFLGPTGAGKTTTVAKLAAHPRVFSGRRVGILNLDTYRVSAAEQIAAYASLTSTPVASVHEPRDLDRAMKTLKSCNVVLVDCPGRGPRLERDLSTIRAILAAVRPTERHLTLPVGTQPGLVRRTIANFAAFQVTHLLATKVDEMPDDWILFDVAAELSLPMRWLTDGQSVPHDVRSATARMEAVRAGLNGRRSAPGARVAHGVA